ncbi:hypothetical protein [Xanthomonas theicola]|uniref:hypothetical protein n=1 Tax=Xanthomonas theicola TaxID=56464 RepID=UPI0020116D3C|nr:hypothetical protein [Xanthomonas theicola]
MAGAHLDLRRGQQVIELVERDLAAEEHEQRLHSAGALRRSTGSAIGTRRSHAKQRRQSRAPKAASEFCGMRRTRDAMAVSLP